MGLILGGFDLLLLGLGANPLIWLAFLLIGLGGAFGLTGLRRRVLRLGSLALWVPLPLLAGAAFAAPCMLSQDRPGACYGEGMALVMSVAVALVWAAGATIGTIMGARWRKAGDRLETIQGS